MRQRCGSGPYCCDRSVTLAAGPQICPIISALIRSVITNSDHIRITYRPAVVVSAVVVIALVDRDRIPDAKFPISAYYCRLVVGKGLCLHARGDPSLRILGDLSLLHKDRRFLFIREMIKRNRFGILPHGINLVILPFV